MICHCYQLTSVFLQTTRSRTPRKKKPSASKKQTTIDQYSGYRRKRKNENSLVVHISLKKIKLSNPIKEVIKAKTPKISSSKSSSEATQVIDNDSKHSASGEKKFKTKAEMKVLPLYHILYGIVKCVICLGFSCHSWLPNISSNGSSTQL